MTLNSHHIDSENGEKIIYERVVMRSGLLLATVGGLALLSLGCGDETSDAWSDGTRRAKLIAMPKRNVKILGGHAAAPNVLKTAEKSKAKASNASMLTPHGCVA